LKGKKSMVMSTFHGGKKGIVDQTSGKKKEIKQKGRLCRDQVGQTDKGDKPREGPMERKEGKGNRGGKPNGTGVGGNLTGETFAQGNWKVRGTKKRRCPKGNLSKKKKNFFHP